MDLNPVFKAKIKYYAENVLVSRNKDSHLISQEYLAGIGLNTENFSDIAEILYDRKCFVNEPRFARVRVDIDPYDETRGEVEEEVEYEALIINDNKLKALVRKYCIDLRELPIIEITKLNLVARQIRTLFVEDIILKIVGNLYNSSEFDFYITKNRYKLNLNDFFIYFAYCKDNILLRAISEFLNPIYFDINSKTSQQKFYNYLNDILKSNISDEVYKEWTKLVSKYEYSSVQASKLNFVYNYNLGRISDDGGINFKVVLEGVEKRSFDVLIEVQQGVKVSWDQIEDDVAGKDKTKKKVQDAISRINDKINLDKDIDALIGYKSYEYWLNYKVTKSE